MRDFSTKPRSVPAPNVRACGKSSPRRPKFKRPKTPGDTPGREAAVRQNATDLMDEEVQRWVVEAAEPKKELFFIEYRGRAVRSSSVTETEH